MGPMAHRSGSVPGRTVPRKLPPSAQDPRVSLILHVPQTPPTRIRTAPKRKQSASCTADMPPNGGNEETRLPEGADDEMEYEADILQRFVASSGHQRTRTRSRRPIPPPRPANPHAAEERAMWKSDVEKEHERAARAAASWEADDDDSFDAYHYAKDDSHRKHGKHAHSTRQTMQRTYAMDTRARQREAAG